MNNVSVMETLVGIRKWNVTLFTIAASVDSSIHIVHTYLCIRIVRF